MPEKKNNNFWRWLPKYLLMIAVLVGCCLALYFIFQDQFNWLWDKTASWVQQWTDADDKALAAKKIRDDINALGFWGPFVFIGLQVFQVVASPIPGELIGPIGGIAFGAFWAVIYSTVGLALGSWLNYFAAKILGRRFVEKVIPDHVMLKFDTMMANKGIVIAFVGFLLPGFPKDYFCYFLGVTTIGTRAFLILSALARIPGTILLSLGGGMLAGRDWTGLIIVSVVTVLLFVPFIFAKPGVHEWLERRGLPRWLSGRWFHECGKVCYLWMLKLDERERARHLARHQELQKQREAKEAGSLETGE